MIHHCTPSAAGERRNTTTRRHSRDCQRWKALSRVTQPSSGVRATEEGSARCSQATALQPARLGVGPHYACRTPERLRQHTHAPCAHAHAHAHTCALPPTSPPRCAAPTNAGRRHATGPQRGTTHRTPVAPLGVRHPLTSPSGTLVLARKFMKLQHGGCPRGVCAAWERASGGSVRGVKAARGCRSKAAGQSNAACPSSHVPSDKVGARSPLECRDTEKHPVPVPELHRKDARIGRCKAKSAWRWRGAAVAGVRRQRPPSWRSHRVREGCTHGAPPSLWVGPAPDTGPPRPRWPGARMCAAATCAAAVPDPTRGKALDTHPPTSPITRFT